MFFLILFFCFQQPKHDQPITYHLQYRFKCEMGSHWFMTDRCDDRENSKEYPVLDIRLYAPNIENFIERYPFVTVEAIGKAESPSTFGAASFGNKTFETLNFLQKEYLNEYFVKTSYKNLEYQVSVELGVGFKNADNILYLRPFVDSWIYSTWFFYNSVYMELSVNSITFHPKNNLTNEQKLLQKYKELFYY